MVGIVQKDSYIGDFAWSKRDGWWSSAAGARKVDYDYFIGACGKLSFFSGVVLVVAIAINIDELLFFEMCVAHPCEKLLWLSAGLWHQVVLI